MHKPGVLEPDADTDAESLRRVIEYVREIGWLLRKVLVFHKLVTGPDAMMPCRAGIYGRSRVQKYQAPHGRQCSLYSMLGMTVRTYAYAMDRRCDISAR
ncbi:hypothetical protein BKG80_00095 [Mycobacteroides chelonae]|nr:hypothetical protein BKG80_00095 [Mycobacteroides chelonae]OLT79072.1 hypothetical protein BKG57_14740 [Mycobacteroides chelonae]